MSIRYLTTASAAMLLFVVSATVRAFDDPDADAANRNITIVKPVSSGSLFPFKNPGVVTLGTLAIQSRIDFAISAFSTNANGVAGGALTYSWNWGDGTPSGSGPLPNHTYVVPGNYNVTVTTTEAGNANPTVNVLAISVTDAVKAAKLQTTELFSSAGGDSISLAGTVRIPANLNLQGQTAVVNVGGSVDGVTFNFKLDAKGNSALSTNLNAVFDPVAQTVSTTQSICSAKFKLSYRSRSKGVDFVDAPFTFAAKNGSFNKALAAEIPNPNNTNLLADRDNVRFTVKITFPTFPIIVNALTPPLNPGGGILFQSGINQLYTASKIRGKTR